MDPASGPRRERQPPQPSLSPRGVDCCPSAARLGLLLGHPSRRSAATAAKASGPAAPSPGGRLGGKENMLLSGHDGLGPWALHLSRPLLARAISQKWPAAGVGCYSSPGLRARRPSLFFSTQRPWPW